MKEKLVISKKWHNPSFLYRMTDQDLSVEVNFEDLIRAIESELKELILSALKDEIQENLWTLDQTTFGEGFDRVSDPLRAELQDTLSMALKSRIQSVTWTFRKATFDKQIDAALDEAMEDELNAPLASSLKAKVGSLSWVFKQEVLDEMVSEAVEGIIRRGVVRDATKRVISGIKAESAKVVGG